MNFAFKELALFLSAITTTGSQSFISSFDTTKQSSGSKSRDLVLLDAFDEETADEGIPGQAELEPGKQLQEFQFAHVPNEAIKLLNKLFSKNETALLFCFNLRLLKDLLTAAQSQTGIANMIS